MQKPTIGRIVHFYAAGATTPQAAIVIVVHSDTCVNVSACNSGGTWTTQTSLPFNEDPKATGDHWCWPPRV